MLQQHTSYGYSDTVRQSGVCIVKCTHSVSQILTVFYVQEASTCTSNTDELHSLIQSYNKACGSVRGLPHFPSRPCGLKTQGGKSSPAVSCCCVPKCKSGKCLELNQHFHFTPFDSFLRLRTCKKVNDFKRVYGINRSFWLAGRYPLKSHNRTTQT